MLRWAWRNWRRFLPRSRAYKPLQKKGFHLPEFPRSQSRRKRFYWGLWQWLRIQRWSRTLNQSEAALPSTVLGTQWCSKCTGLVSRLFPAAFWMSLNHPLGFCEVGYQEQCRWSWWCWTGCASVGWNGIWEGRRVSLNPLLLWGQVSKRQTLMTPKSVRCPGQSRWLFLAQFTHQVWGLLQFHYSQFLLI